jgi:hypothetical protein
MQPFVLPLHVQPPLSRVRLVFYLVLFATLSVASLCRASPSLLVGQLHSLLYVVLVLPHPSPPRLVSLPVCLRRVSLFFLTLGRVGHRPLLCAQDPQFFFVCSFSKLSSQRVSREAFFPLGLGIAL